MLRNLPTVQPVGRLAALYSLSATPRKHLRLADLWTLSFTQLGTKLHPKLISRQYSCSGVQNYVLCWYPVLRLWCTPVHLLVSLTPQVLICASSACLLSRTRAANSCLSLVQTMQPLAEAHKCFAQVPIRGSTCALALATAVQHTGTGTATQLGFSRPQAAVDGCARHFGFL